MFYDFGGSNFWRKTDKRKAIIKTSQQTKEKNSDDQEQW
jgi:hypothetical protein